MEAFFIVLVMGVLILVLTASLAYDLGKAQGCVNCAPEVERAHRYAQAVDNIDRWCGHESPEARLIAAHLKAEGEGLPMNAGTPAFDEPCTVGGLREQLRRLKA